MRRGKDAVRCGGRHGDNASIKEPSRAAQSALQRGAAACCRLVQISFGEQGCERTTGVTEAKTKPEHGLNGSNG